MSQGWLFDPAELLPRGDGAGTRLVPIGKGSLRLPAWSYSKSQTLNTCSRRYYYDYFGSSKRLAPSDPDKAELLLLSQFSTRHLRAGSLLHLGIRTYYKKLLAGDNLRPAGLVDWVTKLFHSDRAASQAFFRTGRLAQGEGFAPVVLLEFVRTPDEADSLFQTALDRLTGAFRNFLTGAAYAPYRDQERAREAFVERRFRVESAGVTLTGQVDFASRVASGFRIVDWKIGEEAISAPESLQLLSYALWATEGLRIPLEEVEILQIPLLGEARDPMRVTSSVVDLARSRIIEDTQMTAALEEFGRQGLTSAFTPRDHPNICALCPYRDPCWKGRKAA